MTSTTPAPGADLATDELLPCPFCQCHITTGLQGTGSTNPKYWIKCPDCPAGMQFFSSTRQQAVDHWNSRRASLAAVPASEPVKQWPFVESPGAFAMRLSDALNAFQGDALAAVRNVLIENPATLAAPAPASGMPDLLKRLADNLEILNARPRPMCRDCADEDGTCPTTGLACNIRALIAEARVTLPAAPAPSDDSAFLQAHFDAGKNLEDLPAREYHLSRPVLTYTHTALPAAPAPAVCARRSTTYRLESSMNRTPNTPANGGQILTDERALFEAALPSLKIVDPLDLVRNRQGDYFNSITQFMFLAWKARAALTTRQAPTEEPTLQRAGFKRASHAVSAGGPIMANSTTIYEKDGYRLTHLLGMGGESWELSAPTAEARVDRTEPWSDKQRDQYRRDRKDGPRCEVCSVTLGGQHFPGCSKEGT